MVLARSTELDTEESQRHHQALSDRLAGFDLATADTLAAVETALGDSDAELVYFYCHGDSLNGEPSLVVGRGEHIPAGQIVTWHVDAWPSDHWKTTHPLVLLNGCHTTQLRPQEPVQFVDVFAAAHAGGVVGTEITLAQTMAGEAAEVLLGELARPEPVGVGEALRRMRLHFLAKGNLLGLAYTAYCSADLKLLLQ